MPCEESALPSTASASCPVEGDSLIQCALKVLNEPDPWKKAEHSDRAVELWRSGKIAPVHESDTPSAPDTPARLPLEVVDSSSNKLRRGEFCLNQVDVW